MPLPKQGSNTFLSNSFLIFITRFFPSLANLVVMIWYSRQLDADNYGAYQSFWIQLFVLYPFICFGIHALVITYPVAFLKTIIGRITGHSVFIYGLWMVAVSAVFAFLQNRTIAINFAIPFLFMIIYASTIILESVHIVLRNFRGLVTVNILYAITYCLMHIIVLHAGFSMTAIFFPLLLLSVARLLLYILMIGKSLKPDKDIVTEPVAVSQVRSLWMHLGIFDISQMLFSYIDKFIVSILLGTSLSAIYYNGSQNIPFLPLLLSAAGSAVLMQLAAGSKQDETKDIVALMNHSARLLSCLVFPLFFFLIVFRSEFLITLFTEKYAGAIPVFMVSVLVIPLRAYSFTTVLQRMHKGSVINTGALIDLVLACALMYPLYRWLGLPGVALSFVITTYLQAGFYLFYSAQLLGVSIFALLPVGNWLIKLIVFGSIFMGIHYLLPLYFTQKITLILGIAVMVVLAATSLWIEYKSNDHVNHAQ